MIPFDFEYYKPTSYEEAVNLYENLTSHGKQPIYYAGGTEIISMARAGNVFTGAVIDIKGIPECNVHGIQNNTLVIGSGITLTSISELNLFPLLSLAVKRIADHTIQGKITLGGNLCGTIIYREAILPLLICDAKIVLATSAGKVEKPLLDIFNKRIHLNNGEFILQIIIDKEFLSLPSSHAKRTKNEKIDYPLITLAALKKGDKIHIAFSGLCKYPFRSSIVEDYLNDTSLSRDKKISNILNNFPHKILADHTGSAEYKKFMLGNMLNDVLDNLKEGN